jgi:hypothetical protein
MEDEDISAIVGMEPNTRIITQDEQPIMHGAGSITMPTNVPSIVPSGRGPRS